MPSTRTSRRPTPADADRHRLLARLHILAKELGMDDAEYRDTLHELTTFRSAAKLDERQLLDVVNHFAHAAGQAPSRPAAGAAGFDRITPAQAARVRALFLERAATPTEPALAAFAKRVAGVDRLEWATGQGARALLAAASRMKPAPR